MEIRKESRLAWKIWEVLDNFNSILWTVYEKEFLKFYQKGHTSDYTNCEENDDKWIFGTESDFVAGQIKKEM